MLRICCFINIILFELTNIIILSIPVPIFLMFFSKHYFFSHIVQCSMAFLVTQVISRVLFWVLIIFILHLFLFIILSISLLFLQILQLSLLLLENFCLMENNVAEKKGVLYWSFFQSICLLHSTNGNLEPVILKLCQIYICKNQIERILLFGLHKYIDGRINVQLVLK